MSSNDRYAISRVTRFHLRISLLWPRKSEELSPSRWFYFNISLYLLVTFFGVVVPLHVSYYHMLKNNLDASEFYALVLTYVTIVPIFISFVRNQKKTVRLIQKLCDFREFGKPPKFEKINKDLDFWSMMYTAYSLVATVIYQTIKTLTIPECKKERETSQICGLTIPIWLPLEDISWLQYCLIFPCTLFTSVIFTRGSLYFCVMIVELAKNFKVRTDHLNSMIINCFDIDLEESKRRLKKCIRYHQQIIRYRDELNEIFKGSCFSQLCGSVLSSAALANQAVHRDVVAFLHGVGWIVAIFFTCRAGQILSDSSQTVADSVWMCDWRKTSPSVRKDLVFVIARSQKRFEFKAGLYNVLSLNLFIQIIKMSYSIFTLMSE